MARALKVCSCIGCDGCGDRCPALVSTGRCDTCKRTADRARGTRHERGYNALWERTRAAYLKDHPVCECDDCAALPYEQRPLATDVDHVDGLGPNGPRGHDPANLRALLHAHHSRRTARDQPGGWNAR